ncbi:hypothetical protein H7Y21_02915 [Arenimonas sp.]|nr:hypothetical protein [Candidatus Parcubacteria bacterium]
MINNLIVWGIGLIVIWFVIKPILEKIGREKMNYVKNKLQSDEKIIKEFDTVYSPKLITDKLYTVRYVGTKYKVLILVTDKRIIFRPYSMFMAWGRNLLVNPISQGFEISYKDQVPKKYMSPNNLKGYFDINNTYPEFSYGNITNESNNFILSADNSNLGKLEVKLFDEIIVNEIKTIMNK